VGKTQDFIFSFSLGIVNTFIRRSLASGFGIDCQWHRKRNLPVIHSPTVTFSHSYSVRLHLDGCICISWYLGYLGISADRYWLSAAVCFWFPVCLRLASFFMVYGEVFTRGLL